MMPHLWLVDGAYQLTIDWTTAVLFAPCIAPSPFCVLLIPPISVRKAAADDGVHERGDDSMSIFVYLKNMALIPVF